MLRDALIQSFAFPQRLKPRCSGLTYGGTKVPPLQGVEIPLLQNRKAAFQSAGGLLGCCICENTCGVRWALTAIEFTL